MRHNFMSRYAVALALVIPFSVSTSAPAKSDVNSNTKGFFQGAPFAGASKMTLADALIQAPKLDTALVPLDKDFKAAEAKLKKQPKDAATKKAYVEAAYKYGKAAEDNVNSKLPPPVQYRAALALYNKALAVDPKHTPSLKEKKQIEDVYKSMHMPVPSK